MCRTIVGVSANLCPVDPEGKNLHSSVSSQFAEGIRQAGGLPMVIPMGDISLVKDYVETIDKLILSGGQNVDPSLYGEEKTIESDDYNIKRDQFELALLKEAIRQNKPVLGICRGVQLINVAFGGTLNQEIEGHWQGLPFGTSHSIQTKNFRATAFDPRDHTIEAIEAVDGHRIIGLQWHPEYLVYEEKGNLELFKYLLQEL